MQAPVVVMSMFLPSHGSLDRVLTGVRLQDTSAGDRQIGRRAQLSNISAAKTYASGFRDLLWECG